MDLQYPSGAEKELQGVVKPFYTKTSIFSIYMSPFSLLSMFLHYKYQPTLRFKIKTFNQTLKSFYSTIQN